MRFRLAPGTATERDLLDVHRREGRLCKLAENTLVEKAMGFRESWLASLLIQALLNFVQPRRLGIVTGEAGMIRLASGLVRIPNVAYIARERLPDRRLPAEPIPGLAPNLIVEVLSRGNTASEMARKRQEYFDAGVQVVWLISPANRTVNVYTAVAQSTLLDEHQTLDEGSSYRALLSPCTHCLPSLTTWITTLNPLTPKVAHQTSRQTLAHGRVESYPAQSLVAPAPKSSMAVHSLPAGRY
ncbi:hypothetical protein C2W62_00270 [Candidatus Entotheonella serta]|nr:hypothetical protein C2W62_00270 [Candidatus Entotheonella serta]